VLQQRCCATDAVLRLLVPGDEVIAANDMYGGTYRLFTKIFEKAGIRFHFVDMQDASAILPHINANTKLIWAETPTNPLINIVDIAALAAIANQRKILFCVDNTFASPYLQNPLTWVLILSCIPPPIPRRSQRRDPRLPRHEQ